MFPCSCVLTETVDDQSAHVEAEVTFAGAEEVVETHWLHVPVAGLASGVGFP